MLYVIDTRIKTMQILQLYYAFSSRGAGGNWDAVGCQSVGSFFGFRVGGACGLRATGAGIGLIDLILSDLGHARSLGSFGCGDFVRGAPRARSSFEVLLMSEMAWLHQEKGRRRSKLPHVKVEGKRLNWIGDSAGGRGCPSGGWGGEKDVRPELRMLERCHHCQLQFL